VNRDRLKISLLPAPIEVRHLLFRSRLPRSRTPCSPLFYLVEIRHHQLHSMISHPLRGARRREGIMRLWQYDGCRYRNPGQVTISGRRKHCRHSVPLASTIRS